MDCTDIVIGTARNRTSRILDYYTRDRSTPRVDQFWGGKSDLTATGGFEENGVTTIIFRRKLAANEPTDHAIIDDLMHVIWARGQEPGKYMHAPLSGLEKEHASVQDFYQPDELKYHGSKMQRGVTQINFLEEPKLDVEEVPVGSDMSGNVLNNNCMGQWRFPRGCAPDKCEYAASWAAVGRGDEIKFKIQTTHTNTWTGIGFSNDNRMSQTDAVIGWVDKTGRPFMMDTWINGYAPPKLDDHQDIYNWTGRIENGQTILEFVRKRESSDPQDLSFTDDHCLFLHFPIAGGAFNAVNKKMRKHEQVPFVTDSRICVRSCEKGLESVLNTAADEPDRLAYAVSVKLMNLAQSFQSPAKGTPEFDSLATQISQSIAEVLTNVPGYYKTDVSSFEKYVTTTRNLILISKSNAIPIFFFYRDDNTMIANMNVLFDKEAYEKGIAVKTDVSNDLSSRIQVPDEGKLVENTIRESIKSEKLGALNVDPTFLHFRALECKSETNSHH